jgi:hypothetical protein
MKYFKFLIAGILAMNYGITFGTTTVVPYLPIRSQGLNTPRHLVGLIQQLYTNSAESSLYGTVTGTLFYNRSFDSSAISECLFGIQDCQTITISGSQIPNRGAQDWLADYFYLPTDFKSTISFKPIIDNIGAELSFFISLGEWTPGLYFAVYAPLVHSRWGLNMCECVDLKGTNSHAPGYFTPDTLQRNELLMNFTQYAKGTIAGPYVQTVADTDYTITLQNLRNARISPTRLSQTRLADMRATFGYQFVRKPRFRLGFELLVSGPVGNRPEGEYLFEPIIGNGHHWEIGGSVIGNGIIWQSQDEEKQIIFTGDICLSHLFAARQKRTLDLKGKPFSRYMLIERLGTPIINNLEGGGVVPTAQFINEFLPVANLTNVCVDVSATIQAEITAMFTSVCDNFSWDIGYNFWARSCENLTLRGVNPFDNNRRWALKGDSFVFGFDRGAAGAGPLVGAVALSATQSNATINSGTNFTADRTVAEAMLNPDIDMPRNATGDASGGMADNPLSADPDAAALTIQTSINPVFIGPLALDECERRAHGLTNKLFTHFSYAWNQREQWIPYVGIGGEVEFNHNNNSSCDTDCRECISCGLSQWGIWLKGVITF